MYVNDLYKASEIVSNSVLLLTGVIFRVLYSKFSNYYAMYYQLQKIKMFSLYMHQFYT